MMETIRFLFLLLCGLVSGLNYCANNSHVEGQWERRPENVANPEKFFCCSREFYYKFQDKCGIYPEDYYYFKGSPVFNAHFHDRSCCGRNVDQHFWKPARCSLLQWNATQFCSLLGNRTILLVGDSTMLECAHTLMSMLAEHGGRCGDQITYGRSEYLIWSIKRFKSWAEYFIAASPDIMVMSVGPHLHDEGDVQMVWADLPKQMVRLLQTQPKARQTKFIWKTINPGHVDCKNFTEPLQQFRIFPDRPDQYQHNLHPFFDKFSVREALLLNMTIMDMHPLYLRPDAHVDCLHTCAPGPVNLFALLLLQMLHNREI